MLPGCSSASRSIAFVGGDRLARQLGAHGARGQGEGSAVGLLQVGEDRGDRADRPLEARCRPGVLWASARGSSRTTARRRAGRSSWRTISSPQCAVAPSAPAQVVAVPVLADRDVVFAVQGDQEGDLTLKALADPAQPGPAERLHPGSDDDVTGDPDVCVPGGEPEGVAELGPQRPQPVTPARATGRHR